jgi:class 3 adenylate cyclase/tetratricopeptide (TPR) repeat protein
VEAERRLVTILFTDMVGFTAFSEKSGEEAAFDLMRSLSQLMDEAVREQGGVVRSFTGDGIMAVFGAPVALEDAPLRACQAALSILTRLKAACDSFEAAHGVRPQLRIGLNTGPAIVGNVQNSADAGVNVLGDTVNVAARFQALAEPNSVCMSEATHRLVQGLVEARFEGEHQIKGKSEPQNVYRLEAIGQRTSRFDAALSRGLTPYVGRDRELETLERCLTETEAGMQVVDIVGDAGVGKSRLLYEFQRRVGRSVGFIFSGSCSPQNQQTPFSPFIEVVRAAFRVSAGEDQPVIARKFDEGLKVLGLWSAENTELLLNLMGLRARASSLSGSDGALIGFRTRDLLWRLLQARYRLSRGIVVIEDIHWIDSASEKLLDEIVTSTEPVQLMIVHTRRPEYRPHWLERPNVRRILLEPLSMGETGRIVEARFGADRLPEELRRLIATKAEGNALFAEELASFLLERGFVRQQGAAFVFDATAVANALPASVQSLLTSRVDRLAPADRAVLQAAAVVGRRFNPDLLTAVTGNQDVDASLSTMQGLDLVHRGDNPDEYVFKHALVRDAVYNSLLSGQRSTLHLKIAEEIERRGANRVPEIAETLAYHYTSTTRADKAFFYLAAAAKKCLDIHSLDEADRYARHALRLLESAANCADQLAVADVMANHVHILYERSDFPGLKKAAESYIPRLEAIGDSAQLVLTMYFHALGLAGRTEFAACEAVSKKALEVAERVGDLKAKTYAMNGILHASTFRACYTLEVMQRLGSDCLALSNRLGDNAALNYAHWNIALDYAFRGLMREAREWALKLLDSGRKRDDRRALGIAHSILAMIGLMVGDYQQSARHSEECLRAAVTPFELRIGFITKASAEIFLGEVQGGLGRLLEATNVAAEAEWDTIVAFATMFIGPGYVLAGRISEGIRLLKSSIATYDKRGDFLYATFTRLSLAQIYVEMLTGGAKPPLAVILGNLVTILSVRLFGVRLTEALLEQISGAAIVDERGAIQARINAYTGILYKLKNKPDVARQYLEKARAPAEHHGVTSLMVKIDAALNEPR